MGSSSELTILSYKAGAYIYVEDDLRADYIYIIRSGEVILRKSVDIEDGEVKNLKPGDFFGVVACMSRHSQIETAQANSEVTLIAVEREQFPLLIKKYTAIAIKMIKTFSQRMRALDESLARATLKSVESTDSLEHLYDVGEYYIKENKFNLAYHAFHRYKQFVVNGAHIEDVNLRMHKIQPYINGVHVDDESKKFNRIYKEDTMIFSESEPGDEMYIIQHGSVKITKIINDKEVLLAMLKPSDIFGEMALIENKPRSASAIAHKETTVMVVNRNNFEKMAESQPQLISRLLELLSNRIWAAYKQLENAQMINPLGKLWDALLIELEKSRVEISKSSFAFDIGINELINMTGLSKADGSKAARELLDSPTISIENNHIYCKDISEIDKQVKYFRKMQQIEKRRKLASKERV